MSFEYANLKIKEMIVHQIFTRNESREIVDPIYSTNLVELSASGLDVLQERIISVVGNESHSINMKIAKDAEGSAFSDIAAIFKGGQDVLIMRSKSLAYKLAEAQTSRRVPGGAIVFCKGTIGSDSKPFITIIKAEEHNGFTLKSTDDVTIEYINSLILTNQQKLYKVGMFINSAGNSPYSNINSNDINVVVFDHNVNKSETKSAAAYFYESFLGCSFQVSPKKITKDFYINTRDFINSLDINDDEKVNLANALHTYLKVDRSPSISVTEFGERYLSDDNQIDEYISFMVGKNMPTNAMVKDITSIKSKLKLRKINFSSDVKISVPADKFNDVIKILNIDDEKTTLEISGKIKDQIS